MDWQSLMKKYVKHVLQSEGEHYIDMANDHCYSEVIFTEEELAALDVIAEELRNS